MTTRGVRNALGNGQALVLRRRGNKIAILEGAEGVVDLHQLIELDLNEAERLAGWLAEIAQ